VKPISLRRRASSSGKNPEFLELTLVPDLGMNLCRIRAFFPGLGEIEVLALPTLEHAQRALNSSRLAPFQWGGAMLLPFANRIRGRVSNDSRTIETEICGRQIVLPANWSGSRPGAEKCAMHGLLLYAKMDAVDARDHTVTASYDAGDFDGHWLSRTRTHFEASLYAEKIEFAVTAKNIGEDLLPMGIGWHPYFALPSQKRQQARVRLPARQRLLVNNYDDVFPTGQLAELTGTDYDFTGPGGKELGLQYLDDCFVDLARTQSGHVVIEITDPEADYVLRLTALSREVKALQVYAPPNQAFIAVEPQFNWADPFSQVWPAGLDTGMVLLAPGEQVTWGVRCELFVAFNG
jgi:aldose 1-epimerase